MFFGIITVLTALSMEAVAAWFAIAGIMAVFSGAPIPALIMGVVVEMGKIVGITWVYRNKSERTVLRYGMLPLIIISVLLTSMGIFGFLSKAHLQQGAPVGNNIAKIERIDQRIQRENSIIDDADIVITQLDETINALVKNERISGPNGARAVRESQADQRSELRIAVENAQQNISKLEDEKFELNQTVREHELDVGPVKYIAALIYEDSTDNLESAVRFVIIAFIFVFDPMAIMLLMAANFTFMQSRGPAPKQRKGIVDDEDDDEDDGEDEPTPRITSIDQLKDTLPPGITIDELKNMISTLNDSHELSPDELQHRDALQQILNQRTVRNKIRNQGQL